LEQSGNLSNIKILTSSVFNYGKKMLNKYMGSNPPTSEFSKNGQEEL